MKYSCFRTWGFIAALLAFASKGDVQSQERFRIDSISIDPEGKVAIRTRPFPDEYLVLLEGSQLQGITNPVAVNLISPVTVRPPSSSTFYRLDRVPRAAARDLDQDGMDDFFELSHPRILNPLQPSDAALDSDDDGDSNLTEFLLHTDPESGGLTRIRSTSPRGGEGAVAVTRETVLRFSRPLAQGTILSPGVLYAEGAGRRILSRVEISDDRRSVTLFHLENLPAQSRIRVTLLGNGLKDTLNQPMDLDGDGVAGGDFKLEFNTLSTRPIEGTGVRGRVLASEVLPNLPGFPPDANRPLPGVTITVDGAEETLRTTTDSEGRFILSPCPAGKFFVHIDGRTALDSQWPDGDYYPVVGKAWEGVAASTNLIPGVDGDIFLPRIRANTLRPVSASSPTLITFPAEVLNSNPSLDGVAITVPAGALFSENGSRGGRVGIAPVAPNRLPEPLPAGLSPALVITIQTDGPLNLSQPAPARFPNLPDPDTGLKLPPGAKTGLWSFNHDSGRWELQGSMTITADGRFAESDRGVGILQPGWHAAAPGSWWEEEDNGSRESLEDKPCDEPPPGVTLWPLLQELNECAINTLGVKEAIKAGEEIGTIGAEAIFGIYQLSQATNALSAVEAGLAFVGLADDVYFAALDVVKITALKKVVTLAPDALTCFTGQTKELFHLLCGIVCADDPVCFITGGVLDAEDELANQIKPALGKLLKAATNPKGFATDTLKSGFLDLLRALGVLTPAGAPPASGPRLASDEDIHRLMALITTEIENNNTALAENLPAIANFVDFIEPRLLGLMEVMQRMMWRSREVHWRKAAWKLEGPGGRVDRGISSAGGEWRLPMMLGSQPYTLTIHSPEQDTYSRVSFVSGSPGTPTRIPTPMIFRYSSQGLPDADADGLADLAEDILGTSPTHEDSDNDGLNDFTEVFGESSRLALPNQGVGPINGADTPGNATSVVVAGDLAALADDTQGAAFFDLSGDEPVLLGRIDTPGRAVSVALEGPVAAVADGASGVALMDVSRPSAPVLYRQIPLDSGLASATHVALRDGIVYAAAGLRGLHVLDASDGSLMAVRNDLGDVDSVQVNSGTVFVLTSTELIALTHPLLGLQIMGRIPVAGPAPQGEAGRNLALCEDLAFVGTDTGYRIIDIHQPDALTQIGSLAAASLRVLSLAHDGSRWLAAALQPDASSPMQVAILDLKNPAEPGLVVSRLDGPGEERSVAWHRGRIVSASGLEGLQVFQPLPSDPGTSAPTFSNIEWWVDRNPEKPGVQAPVGTLVQPRFDVFDDYRIGTVELWMNGNRVALASSCPYNLSATLEAESTTSPVARLQLRATDTAGTATISEELVVELEAGYTGPDVATSLPLPGASIPAPRLIRIVYATPADRIDDVQLVSLGADGAMGGGDDTPVSLEPPQLKFGGRQLSVETRAVLSSGRYGLIHPGGVLMFQVTPSPRTIRRIGLAGLGDWDDASRWEGGRIPGAGDYALIPTGHIVRLQRDTVVGGIDCKGAVWASAESLVVDGPEASEISGGFSGTKVVVRGGGALHLSTPPEVQSLELSAESGARLVLPTLERWRWAAAEGEDRPDGFMIAQGFGSEISFPALTHLRGRTSTFRFSNNTGLPIKADQGGHILAPKLGPEVQGAIVVSALRGGIIDWPLVQSFHAAPFGPEIFARLEASLSGLIKIKPLQEMDQILVHRGTGSSWDFSQLTACRSCAFTLDNGEDIFSRLETASNLSLKVAGGQTVLPALRSANGSGAFNVGGSGASLSAPALEELNGPTGAANQGTLELLASADGVIELPSLRSATGRISFKTVGTRRSNNALLHAPRLESVEGNPVEPGIWSSDGLSRLLLPALEKARNIAWVVQSGGGPEAPRLTELEGGSITASSRTTYATTQFSRLTSVSLIAETLGRIEIAPETQVSVGSVPGLSSRTVWLAQNSSQIRFISPMTPIQKVGSGGEVILTALPGGEIDLSNATSMPAGVQYTAETPQGQGTIDLSGISQLENWVIAPSEGQEIAGTVLSGGTFKLRPAGVELHGTSILLQPFAEVITSSFTIRNGARIKGTGTIHGSILNDSIEGVSPGFEAPQNTSGQIVIDGDYSETPQAWCRAQLNNLGAGIGYDQIVVTGIATLAGRVTLEFTNQNVLAEQFTILTAGELTGAWREGPHLIPSGFHAVIFQFPTSIETSAAPN